MKLLFLLIFVSCAQQQITLKNKELVPFNDFSKITRAGNGLKTISFSTVIDNRENKNEVGKALTGVKYKETPIVMNSGTSNYIKEYLTSALTERGFSVNSMDGINIEVVINELWVEELIEKYQPEKAKCKVNFTFYIKEENASWNGNYWTEIISPGDLADGTEKIAPTFASCLNEVVEKLVTDQEFIKNLK